MSDSTDEIPEIPEEELSEEEKELKKLTASLYTIKLADLEPVEKCIPPGYKLLTKRAKDKTSIFLTRSATFISKETFLVSGKVACLHIFSNHGYFYVVSDEDSKTYCVEIPVAQAYRSHDVKVYTGHCQKILVEGDLEHWSYVQAR